MRAYTVDGNVASSHPQKMFISTGPHVRSMSWHSRIIDEWKDAGTMDHLAWFFGIIYPIFLILKDLGGYVPTYNIYLILDIVLYLVLIMVIILNIKVRKELGQQKNELVEEHTRSKSALASVYEDTDKKIKKEQELCEKSEQLLKSERYRFEKEIDLLRADGLNAAQKIYKSLDNQIKEERDKSKKEIAKWVDRCEKLNESLGHYIENERLKTIEEENLKNKRDNSNLAPRTVIKAFEAHQYSEPTFPEEPIYKEMEQILKEFKEKQAKELNEQKMYKFPDSKAITKSIQRQAIAILTPQTPEELLFKEATDVLKKYDKKE